jgi:hypothetical protein
VGDRGTVLILTVFLVFLLIQVPTAYSAELTAEEKALAFLEDVVMLDMKKYNVTVRTSFENYSTYWGSLYMEDVRCNLESNESKLRIGFVFENYTLTYFHLYVNKGSPLYALPPSTNSLERTDAFLGRYKNYLGTSDCQELRDILSTVTEEKNLTTTVDNVRFELTKEPSKTKLRWDITYNGADYTRLGFSLRSNGEFIFGDTRNLYEIGSTDVDISREEAISIARERAKYLPWKSGMGNETVEVTDYTIVDEPLGASLSTRCREPLVLYPYWSVTLYLDKVYPGNVIGFTFQIWADTGEIINGRLNTLMGGIPPQGSEEPTDSNIIPEFPSWTILPIAFLVVTLFAIIIRKKKLCVNCHPDHK